MRIKTWLVNVVALLFMPMLAACGSSGETSATNSASLKTFKTYTFEGGISDLVSDGGGVIASQGYKVGDHVSAKFAVDFLGQGKMTLNSGEIVIPKDPQMTNDVHSYFYAKLLSGTQIPELNGGMNNAPNDVKLYEVGYNESSPMGNSGVLEGGSGDSSLSVMKESPLDADVQNWLIGEHFKGIVYSCSDQGCSLMWADMVLTAIKEETI